MKYRSNNHGFVKIFHLIMIILTLLVIIPCIKPYYKYYSFSWHTDNTLKMEAGHITAIRDKIMAYAVEKGIPLTEENLNIHADRRKVRVKMQWSDEINLYGYYKKPLTFVIEDLF